MKPVSQRMAFLYFIPKASLYFISVFLQYCTYNINVIGSDWIYSYLFLFFFFLFDVCFPNPPCCTAGEVEVQTSG